MIRPLWRILLDTKDDCAGEMSCAECQAVFALLADLSGHAQGLGAVAQQEMRAGVRRHLACCPDCRAAFDQRLNEMEQWAGKAEDASSSGA